MPGSIELGTDNITSLSRGNGKVKSQLNSIFKIIEAKANVPKQFSAAGNGRFRDVGIRNPWEKEDLNKTNPPQRFYLEGTQDPRANPNLHWLVVDEPMLKDVAKEPLHGEGHCESGGLVIGKPSYLGPYSTRIFNA